MKNYLLIIDQGTTSTRAMVFDREYQMCGKAQQACVLQYPRSGWVEQNAETIWQDVLQVCRQAMEASGITIKEIAGLGITNQRETTIIWDKKTGKPIGPAIVWQDRRTAEQCEKLIQAGVEKLLQTKTGLLADPYFSATKIQWMLDNIVDARKRAEQGELLFGTIDSFLIWHLTGGRHVTDITNASRTLLFDIHQQQWDKELCAQFTVPMTLLPEVLACDSLFGEVQAEHFGATIPIVAVVGDQQAALIGQTCFKPGMAKSTYGTGCFVLFNTGAKIIQSKNRLLTTIAYRLQNKTAYALEGSIFVAGAAVQWLRDAVNMIHDTKESEKLAQQIDSTHGVYFVPAFTGLGAPYWDPLARGAILGLTRDSGTVHIVRAALESVCYQTRDLIDAMQRDGIGVLKTLRVDGGMAVNDWLMQFLADILNVVV